MAENLLEVRDLTITPAGAAAPVLDGVSLTMAPGERVGLIGESGSGKSLTAQSVMGLLPEELRASGSIRLEGFDGDVLAAGETTLARVRSRLVSMVFQEPMSALNPLMRVGDQVAEALRIHGRTARGTIPARVRELLADVRLPDPAGIRLAYPHQLSGGQRQRVMLAIALANSPRLLICDEPTTALDVTVQRHMLDLIGERVAAVDAGLLFITHDLAVVASVCDRVVVMHDGRIVETGSVQEIFTDPQHEYTRGLLASSDLESTDADGRLFTLRTAREYAGPAQARSSASAGERSRCTAGDRSPGTAPPVSPGAVPEGPRPLVEVDGVSKLYRPGGLLLRRKAPVQALEDISFSVSAGSRLGIVGESGSGKSTLLTILSGLDRPSSGSVRVGDIRVDTAGSGALRTLREDLQIVFQDPFSSLDPRMRVEDIVAEPLVAQGMGREERRETVAAMLTAVDIDTAAMRRYPHQFSGGQRQRISIARALVTRPQILVADEPVSALDVSVRAQVLNLLADLVDEYALTLLFVSHDLGVVRHLCSEVIVMKDGHIVEAGDIDDVYAAPRSEYTRDLIAATPSLAAALDSRR
ncbi:peptide/nickel transport system ATP-binding protein [Brevibacterium sanguinis]|uniref:Peptide/nickel transport system ATP-binding protein n=2 Tax=Brevibacterium TaxID=1696 RepID=A0A366II56_9MICO|nr:MULTISPECIES: ABC transporter ATP-binding protein [Brevibacterium]RBP63690.1 peptide/nickel transport system ATP-binding protein [Brevibacterium sanguinis]RBP70349.1 peptide/nickel transport system ATP-binding protein [Brevibacterium celere]